MKYFKNFEAMESDLQTVLKQLLQFNAKPLEELSPNNARNNPTLKNAVDELAAHSAMVRTLNVAMPVLPEKVGRVEHMVIPTRDGEVNARVFYPKHDKVGLSAMVYFHGGGWVIADLNTYESSCRALCNAADMIVVSVAYRQAPENKFPAAVNDAYDAVQWVFLNARNFGGDPDRVFVGGESAGGNLATVACLMAKHGGGKMPIGQLLIYPVTDTSAARDSYQENQDTQPLHSNMMPWFFGHYLENKTDAKNPYVAPLLAEDLSGLPPAIVITAEFDPLRDEGEEYASRLSQAGIPVISKRFDGMSHEFFGLAGAVAKAKEAVHFAADSLKNILAQTRTPELEKLR